MLQCVAAYRNVALGLNVQPGEILRTTSPEQEAWVMRDSPECFVVYEEPPDGGEGGATVLSFDGPPMHLMIEREMTARLSSERVPAPAPTEELPTPEGEPAPEAEAAAPEAPAEAPTETTAATRRTSSTRTTS